MSFIVNDYRNKRAPHPQARRGGRPISAVIHRLDCGSALRYADETWPEFDCLQDALASFDNPIVHAVHSCLRDRGPHHDGV